MSFINLAATDFVVSNDGVTAPAWTDGNPSLGGLRMYTTPGYSVAPTFYTDVYVANADGSVTSSIPNFSVAYGHISGSGATLYNTLVPSASATRTVYNQFRNLVYADENTSFNFGTGNTSAEDIYVINVNRACYKESLFPGTFNLRLSNGTATEDLYLTNDSNDSTSITYLDCGRVYNLVSGSNGYQSANDKSRTNANNVSGSYGLFLPDVGIIIVNPRRLSQTPGTAGGLGINPVNAGTASWTYDNTYNQQILVGAMQKANCYFNLNSYETVSSDYVFVRVPNNQFNYTTNPSVISGSGALIYSTMINNPQTYMTTVGLYNDNQELLAVAKLSKPLVKDFTKESLIQVKLNW